MWCSLHSQNRYTSCTQWSYLIEAKWCLYASVKHTTIASDNGLSPIRGAKPLYEPMLLYCHLDPMEHISETFYLKYKCFHLSKYTWKCCLEFFFVLSSMCPQCVNQNPVTEYIYDSDVVRDYELWYQNFNMIWFTFSEQVNYLHSRKLISSCIESL